MLRFITYIVFPLSIFSAQAVVLDWSGSYLLEINTVQNGDFEYWGSSEAFHNLHLKPDIKAFDEVRVKSWFQLSTPSSVSNNFAGRKFAIQKGVNFNWDSEKSVSLPGIAVRDLYLEVAHDFGLLQVGWKPHHFGLGMYYNDSSALFDPFYNLEGSRGFISWRGFIGSSYYIQPMVHYVNDTLFNLFIQAGFSTDQYGVEAMYKTSPQGIEGDNSKAENIPSYIGIYGYYNTDTLTAQLEVGRTSDEVYGGVLDIDWESPIKWLSLGLDMGLATSEEKKAFHFDPSFSSRLSFLIEEYENLKPKGEAETTQSEYYSFHSAFYLSPSLSFSLLDSLNLKSIFSIHISYSEMDVLFYHKELMLEYQLAEGLTWSTGVGVLFPREDNWHIGLISQAAITF